MHRMSGRSQNRRNRTALVDAVCWVAVALGQPGAHRAGGPGGLPPSSRPSRNTWDRSPPSSGGRRLLARLRNLARETYREEFVSRITSLALTDVRCFAQTQEAEFPRITVLMGENSTGKSTFLGCVRMIARLSELVDLSDRNLFDDPPFSMGGFETIARSGVSKFAIEATLEGHRYDRVRVVYDRGPGGEPRERVLELSLSAESGQPRVFRVTRPRWPRSGSPEMWRVAGPEFEFEFPQSLVSHRQFSRWLSSSARRGNLPHEGDAALWRNCTGDASPEAVRMFARFTNFFRRSDLFPGPEHRLPVAVDDPNGWPRKREYASNPFGEGLDDDTLERVVGLGRRLNLFSSLDIRRGRRGTYEIWCQRLGRGMQRC